MKKILKSGNSKQKTLFQAWEGKVAVKPKPNPKKEYTKSHPVQRKNKRLFTEQEVAKMCTSVVDLTNDLDDKDLVEAVEVMESSMIEKQPSTSSHISNKTIETLPGFDNNLGSIWIYPTNYPLRDYQYSIVKSALFKNTLVSLPTGLGKTFIAAVVMYNFYRWYPQGKIVFMAPTKPLVSQQIEACYKIMGIPYDDQAEITGMTTPVHKREELWRTKRVFFLTPQVINNDLVRGVCPATDIKCIVIDEAHKAQGKHAYCQVINQLAACSKMFRVLALSATPGTDVNSVQQVIHNLLISHIEIRSEDSIDIRRYSHHRKIEKVVCKLDKTMISMSDNYLKVIEIFTNSLVNKNALYQRDTASYSKFGILLSREQFRKNPPTGLTKYELGSIEGDFATCISLFHGFELLQQHGMRSFYIFIKAMMEGEKGSLRAKTVLNANQTFREMFASLVNMFGNSPNANVAFTQAESTLNISARPQDVREYVYSHPKITKLEEVVLGHFTKFAKDDSSGETRVMVFCQYRDTVQEITELLQKHRPLIKPMQFVGHSNASGKMAKFTQKDQLQVVSKFRSGGYNTLISTCVGEEGLDIGDVDLIVCFDAHKSPIRLVQRMGRTGRKREGRIVMLVTEGKEERDYNSSVSNRKSIQKAITGNSSRSFHFYTNNPRMVPRGLNPQPLKMAMTVLERPTAVSAPKKKKTKSTNMDMSLIIKNEVSKNSVYLTADQVKEWDNKFKLSGNEKTLVKSFPTLGRMECLGNRSSEPRKGELCFAEWNLWQVRLQDTALIGHSSITKNFVETMIFCDHLKQTESMEWNKFPQDQSCHSAVGKEKISLMKKQKSPNVVKQTNLDNFITESPCNEDDTLIGIESFVDEDATTSEEKLPAKETAQFQHHDDVVMKTHKQESNISSQQSQKVTVQNPTTVDLLLDFINDLSDGSCDELLPPKQESCDSSDQDENDDCAISDSVQPPNNVIDLSSPPAMDFVDQPVADVQNLDEADSQNFTQSFDIDFEDEEDLFSNTQFDFNVTKGDVTVAEKSKLQNNQDHIPNECDVSFQNKSLPKPCLSDNICNLGNPVFHSRSAEDRYQSVAEDKKTPICPETSCNRQVKKTTPTDAPKFESTLRNHESPDIPLRYSSNEDNSNVVNPQSLRGEISETGHREENVNDKDSEDMFSNSLNSGIPNFDLNASIDMFSPNFDFGFDIGGMNPTKFDNAKEKSITQSPILSNSSKVTPKRRKENSPGQITITQKVENRVLFADLGKLYDTSKTQVAQVKPHLQCETSSELTTSPIHGCDPDQESPFLFARNKRSLDISDQIIAKRKKEGLKTPGKEDSIKIFTDSESLQDSESPFLVPKNRKRRNKMLLISPESDKSGYGSDKDKSVSLSCHNNTSLKVLNNEVPASRKRRSDDRNKYASISNPKKQSTPKTSVALDDLSDDDFQGEDTKRLKAKLHPPKQIPRKLVEAGFVDFEAEVSQDGAPISTDEDSEIDPAALEEMKNFVNDASVLTQHVGIGPGVDEHAMYLRGNADFLDEGGQFGNNNAKFKLAFNIRSDIDVFSQEPAAQDSDYEQNSFVCDDEEQHDATDLGEITLLDHVDSPIVAGKLTRRQVELNRLKKFNKDSSIITEKKTSNKGPPRKRIICLDDSMDSMDSGKSPDSFLKRDAKSEKEAGGWTCPACTQFNKPSCQLCQICDCERPSSDVANKPAWTCKSCTYINCGQIDVCNMCGKLRSLQKTKQKTKKSFGEQKPSTSGNTHFISPKRLDQDFVKKQDTAKSVHHTSGVVSNIADTPTGNPKIEERLKKVLKKRLDFKARRESQGTPPKVKVVAKSAAKAQNIPTSMSHVKLPAQDVINSSITSSTLKSDIEAGPIVVLVDSKELSSSQPIITMLRSKFQANVTVASLPHCDYIIGIGTAVTRLTVSDVSQISSKQKLSSKFQQLNVHYDRVYAVIEQDSVKKGDISKRVVRSTQFMSMMCSLAQCNIKVLYSENQDETASILKMLAARERQLKRVIDVEAAAKATDANSRLLLKLFLNMPKVSFVSALYMCLHFKNFKEAASSSVEKLIQKAHLSTYAAAEVYTFCRRKFDIQMTPTR